MIGLYFILQDSEFKYHRISTRNNSYTPHHGQIGSDAARDASHVSHSTSHRTLPSNHAHESSKVDLETRNEGLTMDVEAGKWTTFILHSTIETKHAAFLVPIALYAMTALVSILHLIAQCVELTCPTCWPRTVFTIYRLTRWSTSSISRLFRHSFNATKHFLLKCCRYGAKKRKEKRSRNAIPVLASTGISVSSSHSHPSHVANGTGIDATISEASHDTSMDLESAAGGNPVKSRAPLGHTFKDESTAIALSQTLDASSARVGQDEANNFNSISSLYHLSHSSSPSHNGTHGLNYISLTNGNHAPKRKAGVGTTSPLLSNGSHSPYHSTSLMPTSISDETSSTEFDQGDLESSKMSSSSRWFPVFQCRHKSGISEDKRDCSKCLKEWNSTRHVVEGGGGVGDDQQVALLPGVFEDEVDQFQYKEHCSCCGSLDGEGCWVKVCCCGPRVRMDCSQVCQLVWLCMCSLSLACSMAFHLWVHVLKTPIAWLALLLHLTCIAGNFASIAVVLFWHPTSRDVPYRSGSNGLNHVLGDDWEREVSDDEDAMERKLATSSSSSSSSLSSSLSSSPSKTNSVAREEFLQSLGLGPALKLQRDSVDGSSSFSSLLPVAPSSFPNNNFKSVYPYYL